LKWIVVIVFSLIGFYNLLFLDQQLISCHSSCCCCCCCCWGDLFKKT